MSDSSDKAEKLREEMWEAYFLEIEDLLERLEAQLLDIENDASNNEMIAALFRTMHTFKGTSGMMGLINLEDLAHCAEDVMDLARNDRMEMTEHTVDLLFKTLDQFTSANTTIRKNKKDVDRNQVSSLIDEFKEVLQQCDNISGPANPGDDSVTEFGIIEGVNTEIDEEYVEAFFELAWENLEYINDHLADLANPETQANTLTELIDYCTEWLYAADQIGLTTVVARAKKFNEELNEHKNDKNILSTKTGEIGNLFAELEKAYKSGNLNTGNWDTKNSSLSDKSDQEAPLDIAPEVLESPFAQLNEEMFDNIWSSLSQLRGALQKQEESRSLAIDDNEVEESKKALANFNWELDNELISDANKATTELIDLFNEQPRDIKRIGKSLSDVYTIFWELEEEFQNLIESNPGLPISTEPSAADTSENKDKRLGLIVQDQENDPNTDPQEDALTFDHSLVYQGELNALDNQDETNTQVFIEDYIDDLQNHLIRLRGFLFSEEENKKESCTSIIEHLIDRSENIGMFNIADHIKLLHNILKVDEFEISNESYNDFEITIYEHIAQMLDTYRVWPDHPNAKSLHTKNVFLQWHAEKLFIFTGECISSFRALADSSAETTTIDDTALSRCIDLVKENIKNILFGCQYYDLDSIESMLLQYEDFLLRVQVKPELLDLDGVEQSAHFFATLACTLNEIVDLGEADEKPLEEAFAPLGGHLVEHDSSLVDTAIHFIHGSPTVPKSVKDGLNESELEKIAGLLAQERPIFLIFADLESNDNIAMTLTDRLSETDLTIITSITDYIDEQSVFYFLVSPDKDADAFFEDIKGIDTDKKYCFIQPLSHLSHNTPSTDSLLQGLFSRDEVSTKIGETQNILGQLISIKANLAQASENVSQIDLLDQIDSLMIKHGKDWKNAREDVRSEVNSYESEVKGMLQAQSDLSLNLDKLQDNLNEIGQINSADATKSICEWYNERYKASGLELIAKPRDGAVQKNKFSSIIPTLKNILHNITHYLNEEIDLNAGSLEIDIAPHDGSFILSINLPLQSIPSSTFGFDLDTTHHISNNEDVFAIWSLLGLTGEYTALIDLDFKQTIRFEKGALASLTTQTTSEQQILDGIVVEAQNNTFVFPIEFIKRIVNLSESEIVTASANDKQKMLKVENDLIPIRTLIGNSLAMESKIALVLEYMDQESAVLIDELVGIRQVMTSPAHGLINNNEAIMGLTVLGKDSVGIVMDTGLLTRAAN